MIGDYVRIGPNMALGGTVRVGAGTRLGIGVTVINSMEICTNCIVSEGAVIIKPITGSGIYVGVPARRIE